MKSTYGLHLLLFCFSMLAIFLIAACSRKDEGRQIHIAIVTDSADDFWKIARKGSEKADEELHNVQVEFRLNAKGTAAEQQRIVDDLIARGVSGVAITPVDPAGQAAMIDSAAQKALVMTQYSDAPNSDRVFYLGTDNHAAGMQAGELLRQALPQGGKVVVFASQDAVQANQTRYEGIKEALAGSNIEILDTRMDHGELFHTRASAADALVRYPQVAGLVGLWKGTCPRILDAVRDAGKAGKIKIVCFGDDGETLDGVKAGVICGTIVQQPYEFGYQAVHLMARILGGDRSVIPPGKQQFIPTVVITQSDVDEFTRKMSQLHGQG